MTPPPPRPDTGGNAALAWASAHKVWTAVIAVIVVLMISAAMGDGSDPQQQAAAPAASASHSFSASQEPSQAPVLVSVPDVIGLSSETALKKLKRSGLVVLGGPEKTFSHQPPGTALHLSVHVGTKVDKGTSISLVIAKPYPKVANVVGWQIQKAVSKLKADGYSVSITKQTSSQSAGTVISSSPGPGSDLLPGKTVKLVVAKAAPAPPTTSCTAGYSPCLPSGPSDYDCSGGSGDGPAYTQPGVTYQVTGSDPYGLDADNDGSGCE